MNKNNIRVKYKIFRENSFNACCKMYPKEVNIKDFIDYYYGIFIKLILPSFWHSELRVVILDEISKTLVVIPSKDCEFININMNSKLYKILNK